MSDRTCTPTEIDELLEILRYRFGGFAIYDAETQGHRDVMAAHTKATVHQAIKELVLVTDHRPSPNDLAVRCRMVLRKSQPDKPAEPYSEVAPPEVVDRWLNECRRSLAAAGARRNP